MIFTFTSGQTFAIETAPRISDKEIIESLGDLKAEVGDLKVKMTVLKAGQQAINQRFNDINQRLNDINQRFDDVNQRFDGISQRFSELWTIMVMILASIFGLIGFVVWDRKTAMKPLEQKLAQVEQNLTKIEKDLEHDLELNSPEGSKLTRMIHAFRELAIKDKEVAEVLRSFSLL